MGADAPASGLDLWSSEVLVDPWEHFREIRNTAPVVYLERYDHYAVGRYGDVRGVLRDWQTFTSADGIAFNDLMNEATVGTAPGAIRRSTTPSGRRCSSGSASPRCGAWPNWSSVGPMSWWPNCSSEGRSTS